MHTFDVSYFLCLFICVMLEGSPAVPVLLHFSLFLWKPRGLFCSREEKCQGGHHPLGTGGQGALSTWLCRWGRHPAGPGRQGSSMVRQHKWPCLGQAVPQNCTAGLSCACCKMRNLSRRALLPVHLLVTMFCGLTCPRQC